MRAYYLMWFLLEMTFPKWFTRTHLKSQMLAKYLTWAKLGNYLTLVGFWEDFKSHFHNLFFHANGS